MACGFSCRLILLDLVCRMASSSSKKRRFKSVKDWLIAEIQRRRTLTDADRRELSRARKAAGKTASVRLQAGRPPRSSVTPASASRAKRRQRVAALRVLPAIAAQLVRLRVVGKYALPLASDIRRGLRFAVEFRALAPRSPVALLTCLFFERAWRDPKLSRRLLTAFGQALQTGCGCAEAAWRSIVSTRRRAPADKPNHKYWPGPAAFHAAQGPWLWQRSDIEALAKELYQSRVRVDAEAFVVKLSCLPYVSAYGGFSYLRMAETLGMVQLYNQDKIADRMSGTVRALTSICPVKEWLKHMRRLPGVDKDCFTLGDTALLVCETAKALQSLGFTVPRHSLHHLPVFITELGSSCGASLLSLLAAAPPLALEQVCKKVGARSSEASEVDRHFPPTRSAWDRLPHLCRGSESVAPMFVQQLRRSGFLVRKKRGS